MVGRSLSLRRLGASIFSLTLVFAMVGCTSDRVYEEAVRAAESGVAVVLEATTERTVELLSSHSAISEISEDDIVVTFVNDMRGYTRDLPGPVTKQGVFDVTESSDGTVSFSVFFGSSVFRSGGLVTTNQSRHSCGIITGRFTEREFAIEDLACPPEIRALAGEDSIAVSMTENALEYNVEIGKSP